MISISVGGGFRGRVLAKQIIPWDSGVIWWRLYVTRSTPFAKFLDPPLYCICSSLHSRTRICYKKVSVLCTCQSQRFSHWGTSQRSDIMPGPDGHTGASRVPLDRGWAWVVVLGRFYIIYCILKLSLYFTCSSEN
jgi:hypothetical protein